MSSINASKTVLVTGATSGIGYEIAKHFARDNYNLVLVARTAIDLETVASELRDAGAPAITCLDYDLSLPGVAADLYNEIQQRDIEIEMLVNNAGIGEHGLFAETDLAKEMGIIQLNIASVVQLTKLFLRDMLERGSGRILNVASVVAYQPTPKLAVYAATKSFILFFSDALIHELKKTNIHLTVLVPGSTDTDFFNKAGMENTVAAQGELEDPAVVAKLGYEGLMKGEHHVLCQGVRQQVFISSMLSNDNVASMAGKQMEEKH